MQDYTSATPAFSKTISLPEVTDPAHAENALNPAPKQLLQNDLVLSGNQAEEYDEDDTYDVGAIRQHGGKVYKCNTAITTAEEWDPTHWDETTLAEAIENAGGGAEDVGLSVVDGKVCITYEV